MMLTHISHLYMRMFVSNQYSLVFPPSLCSTLSFLCLSICFPFHPYSPFISLLLHTILCLFPYNSIPLCALFTFSLSFSISVRLWRQQRVQIAVWWTRTSCRSSSLWQRPDTSSTSQRWWSALGMRGVIFQVHMCTHSSWFATAL